MRRGGEQRDTGQRGDVADAARVLVRARRRTAGAWRRNAPRRLDERNAGIEADARRRLIGNRRRDRVLPIDDVGLLGLALPLPFGAVVVDVGGGVAAGEGQVPGADLLIERPGCAEHRGRLP